MSKPLIGLDMLYYAVQTADTESTLSYDTPVRIVNVVEANAEIQTEEGVFYADDGAAESDSQIKEVDLSLTVANLPPADYVELLGIQAADYTDGVIDLKTTIAPPYVAIGYRRQLSGGGYRYMWLMKGKMSVPSEAGQTKGEAVNYQTQQLNFKCLKTVKDSIVLRRVDSTDTTVAQDAIDDWFTTPLVTGTPPNALTVTPSPADTATEVAVDANITFTFNYAIQDSYVHLGNFYLMDTTTATAIAAALSIDATKKVVTINPTENLAAATSYIAVASAVVKDVFGQQKSTNTIVNFTTAA